MVNKKVKPKDLGVSKEFSYTKEELEGKQDHDLYKKVHALLSEGKSVIEISKELDITLNSTLYWANKVNGKSNLVDEIRKALDSDTYETYDLAKKYTKTPAAIKRLVEKAELQYSPADSWVKKAAKSGIRFSKMKLELGVKSLDRAKEILQENFKKCFIVSVPFGNDDYILMPVHSSKDDVEWVNIDTSI